MSSVTNSALRDSIRVDLTRITPWGGALRAFPVVALVTFGLGIGSAKTALTFGVGANLVAVVSLVGSTRVAMSVVHFDVVGLGCATFVGAATAFNTPLHLSVLAIWCFGAGHCDGPADRYGPRAIALGVYMAWPTWSSSDAYDALRHLIEAERRYLAALFAALEGDVEALLQFSERTRAVRLAFGAAEAAIARSADEPRRHRSDDDFGRGTLAAARRVAQSAHSLRSELERGLSISPLPAFEDLGSLLDRELAGIGVQLGGDPHHESFPLRDHYLVASTALAARDASPVISLQLDEIVDAANTIEAIVIEHGEHAGPGLS